MSLSLRSDIHGLRVLQSKPETRGFSSPGIKQNSFPSGSAITRQSASPREEESARKNAEGNPDEPETPLPRL
jgi:hypothetical protein